MVDHLIIRTCFQYCKYPKLSLPPVDNMTLELTVKVCFVGTFWKNQSDIQTNSFACHR